MSKPNLGNISKSSHRDYKTWAHTYQLTPYSNFDLPLRHRAPPVQMCRREADQCSFHTQFPVIKAVWDDELWACWCQLVIPGHRGVLPTSDARKCCPHTVVNGYLVCLVMLIVVKCFILCKLCVFTGFLMCSLVVFVAATQSVLVEKWEIVKVCLKTRKHPSNPFSFSPCPSIISPSDCSSRPIRTLPLTLKPNLPSTLTFPTLTDFLGEPEMHFSSLSFSLSFSGNDFYHWLHAYLRDVFLFFFLHFLSLCSPLCTVRASICFAEEWSSSRYLHLLFSARQVCVR